MTADILGQDTRQRAVPNGGLAIFLMVAIVVGSVLPAPADERPSDPFGNHTAELNKDAPLAKAGCVAFLRKPFQARQLIDAIKKALP